MAEGDEITEVRSVIDVDILGHIFEQSITDLERLRLSLEAGEGARTFLSAEGGGGPPEADKNVRAPQRRDPATTRRKQEGAVYTRAFITRYIVQQTLGGVLKSSATGGDEEGCLGKGGVGMVAVPAHHGAAALGERAVGDGKRIPSDAGHWLAEAERAAEIGAAEKATGAGL